MQIFLHLGVSRYFVFLSSFLLPPISKLRTQFTVLHNILNVFVFFFLFFFLGDAYLRFFLFSFPNVKHWHPAVFSFLSSSESSISRLKHIRFVSFHLFISTGKHIPLCFFKYHKIKCPSRQPALLCLTCAHLSCGSRHCFYLLLFDPGFVTRHRLFLYRWSKILLHRLRRCGLYPQP